MKTSNLFMFAFNKGLLFMIFFTGMFFPLNAQYTTDFSNGECDRPRSCSIQSRTVSQHSVGVNGLGLAYGYEQPIAPYATVLFNAGFSYILGGYMGLDVNERNALEFTEKYYSLLTGSLSVEPRYYYNLGRRHRQGKRTFGNSGGYISVSGSYMFPLVGTKNVIFSSAFLLTPYWGFQRVWRHFMFDLAGGPCYVLSTNGEYTVTAALRLGLAYKF